MKTIKKPKTPRPKKEPWELIKDANYLNLAVFIRILNKDFGFGEKRLKRAVESYCALIDEIADKRSTVTSMVRQTTELTGIDTKLFLEYVMTGDYNGWRKELGVE